MGEASKEAETIMVMCKNERASAGAHEKQGNTMTFLSSSLDFLSRNGKDLRTFYSDRLDASQKSNRKLTR